LQVAVQQNFSRLAHDTDVQGTGMHIDPTIPGRLVGVESPEVFSSVVRDVFPRSAYHWGMGRRRPQSLSRAWSRRPTASAALPLPAAAHAWR
jgi:hypothetical protein